MSTADATLGREVPALDERLYSLDSDELAFLLTETHFRSESDLKSHLLDLQAKAYKVSVSRVPLVIQPTQLHRFIHILA